VTAISPPISNFPSGNAQKRTKNAKSLRTAGSALNNSHFTSYYLPKVSSSPPTPNHRHPQNGSRSLEKSRSHWPRQEVRSAHLCLAPQPDPTPTPIITSISIGMKEIILCIYLTKTRPSKTTRPGVRSVAPKKANLIKNQKLVKVCARFTYNTQILHTTHLFLLFLYLFQTCTNLLFFRNSHPASSQ
jgi:hypothetical protein